LVFDFHRHWTNAGSFALNHSPGCGPGRASLSRTRHLSQCGCGGRGGWRFGTHLGVPAILIDSAVALN
jgi:hypothetical protein